VLRRGVRTIRQVAVERVRGPRFLVRKNNKEQIMSRELPSSIAIIGAGPVGIESPMC
jgi:pyruvate/2-oxoglutarate dehydrogenase complex dihydrolipoamide dehydrogenase (E3) component